MSWRACVRRDVIAEAALEEKERAKNLLRAAGKLADYVASLRTGHRFTGRHVVPQLYPADVPLPGSDPRRRTAVLVVRERTPAWIG